MKIYKINNAEFVSEELTLGEMEDLLALVGQLKLNIKSSNNSGDEKRDGAIYFPLATLFPVFLTQ